MRNGCCSTGQIPLGTSPSFWRVAPSMQKDRIFVDNEARRSVRLALVMNRGAIAVAVVAIAWVLLPSPADAACNIIPSATGTFRGALGSPLRPFAAPGETVELRIREAICDGASPGFSATPANHVVTVVFTPPG